MAARATSGKTKGGKLIRAASLSYLGAMVLVPLAALSYESVEPGPSAFLKAIRDPFAFRSR